MNIEHIRPSDIEKHSMEIITSEIGDISRFSEAEQKIVLRTVHTTADFDYAENLTFSPDAVSSALAALKDGAVIVTDTNMTLAGISKPSLRKLGCEAVCFNADEDVIAYSKEHGVTRAVGAVNKAAEMYRERKVIYSVGNAPTALIRIHELINEGALTPALVIGVPVGFVNVMTSKELIMQDSVPYIVARGRKGGSTVSAAICNALLYMLCKRDT